MSDQLTKSALDEVPAYELSLVDQMRLAADVMDDSAQRNTKVASILRHGVVRINGQRDELRYLRAENVIFREMLAEYGPKCRVCGVSAEPTVVQNNGICADCKSKENA